MESTMLMCLTCQRETAEEVASALAEMFRGVGVSPHIAIDGGPSRPGDSHILIDTGRPYTDKAALDLYSEQGYDTVFRFPGVLSASVISSTDSRPVAMTELDANTLAAQITRDAPWLDRVTVEPVHTVNDDFTPDECLFVCLIGGLQFRAEIYNATEWGELIERLNYENRISEFSERTEEPGVRPFHRYVLDSPALPHYGNFGYASLERYAAKNYLLDANLPPWRSAVRSLAGVKAIYELSGVCVPLSVATFLMRPGDQALIVTPTGETGLLIREK